MAKSKPVFVFFLFLLGLVFHFTNSNWGAPFYFHPDERNIASSVAGLQFPHQMNPHFFAYGSLPIYTIFFTNFLANSLMPCQLLWDSCEKLTLTFSQAIIMGRLFSALFSTLLIPLLFFLGKKIKDEQTGKIAAFFATTSIGLTQFAHFETFEMWLTFFGVMLFWFTLQTAEKKPYRSFLAAALTSGVLVAIKISSLVLLPLPLFALFLRYASDHKHPVLTRIVYGIRDIVFFFLIVVVVYCITNPYVLLDQKDFLDSMRYESSVALGTLPVFYTAEFFTGFPLLFQAFYDFPFLLNPLLLLFAIPSFFYVLLQIKKVKALPSLFLILFFLFLLISQAFFFVKWTRYMVPTLPFLYLMTALTCSRVLKAKQLSQTIKAWGIWITMSVCLLFCVSYLITVFIEPDTRVAAAAYAQKVIPTSSPILSEVYDLGITPFNSSFPNITLFNFYDLDNNSPESNQVTLTEALSHTDYIILPSQRIMKSRLLQQKRFPVGNQFYTALFDGKLGFEKIYETPCDLFCEITYLGSPSFRFEQTTNVFDRPTVYIFKKAP